MTKPRLMVELKQRILPIFLRRTSDLSQRSESATTTSSTPGSPSIQADKSKSKTSLSLRHKRSKISTEPLPEENRILIALPSPSIPQPDTSSVDAQERSPNHSLIGAVEREALEKEDLDKPVLTLERPTPEEDEESKSKTIAGQEVSEPQLELSHEPDRKNSKEEPSALSDTIEHKQEIDYFGSVDMPSQTVLHKRVWVKRQGASATLVQISDDDLVDDVREKILRKYANSLGKTFDSPDVTLRIIPRPDSHGHHERSMGPEEPVASTLNQYYPSGQTIDEALIIDIPHRRTPRHSPRVYMDHHRPSENGGDYFSVMPVALNHSPHLNSTTSIPTLPQQPIHAISVLNTGQLPPVPLPSPGGTSRRHGTHRPKYGRTTTSSPTVLTTNASHANSLSDRVPGTPAISALPTPPLPTVIPPRVSTPPPRATSPKPPRTTRPKKPKKAATATSQSNSLLDGGVPPISVLIVEDNIINLRLLEAFMKRLKVRWQTAMNGRDAVMKWRTGGFHLVLMDIQLPIMNGLEATREIRRLESVNGIGVLSAKVGDTADSADSSERPQSSDQLQNMDQFKSPVIVVALTASSLQSDRHEALAAGCNDFLTKPVNFPWLERKVMEWGCMQALIDFDGWRKWKDFSQPSTTTTKSSKSNAATTSSNTKSSSAAPKAVKRAQETNSDSTDNTDSPSSQQAAKPSVPETLVALNDKTESADTIDSLESVASNDSVETIDLITPRRTPLVPSLSTLSSTSSTSTVNASQVRASSSRQTSAQSARSPINGPASPNRSATNLLPKSPTTTAAYEENRRRKRSSLGRPGLSGVVEELEGIGAS